jgi:hypothetical protein
VALYATPYSVAISCVYGQGLLLRRVPADSQLFFDFSTLKFIPLTYFPHFKDISDDLLKIVDSFTYIKNLRAATKREEIREKR